MLDPEIKAEWVTRLRSGRYEQGTGHLSMDGKYCCLGVLGELLVEKGMCQRHLYGGQDKLVAYGISGVFTSGYLPREVTDAIAMDFDLQSVYGDMNDHNTSFSAIADAIEADERL